MTTFPLQSPRTVSARPFFPLLFARVFATLTMYVQALAEAQQMARAAGRHYPFAE
jgi:hypothetical protein